MRLRLIGYWSGGYGTSNGHWPDPATLVDPSWDEDERIDVGLYLRRGLMARAYMGFSPCRMCDETQNGNLELTDGTYIWPEGLAHYVLEHKVRLPHEFVEHTQRQQEAMDEIEIDDSWWRAVGT